jgi:alkylation response protein AidB-like acyl-CoA dehydrogenase
MKVLLNEEQLALRENIIKFVRNELNQTVIEDENISKFNLENWKKCADLGLLSLIVPQQYGGSDADPYTILTSLQALSYACKDSGLVHAIVTQLCCMVLLMLFGSESQKKKYFPRLEKGELIAAQAITEPGAGSDVSSIITKAEKQSDHYLVNGRKTFISNGPIADIIFVFVVTDSKRKNLGGISCLLVEKERKGLHLDKPMEKMGLRTLQNGDLIFEDCQIPHDDLVGREGQGMIIFNEVIEWERAFMAATHLGTLERIFESCVKYANTREQFGQAISKFQSISHKIANMRVTLELGKLIVYKIGYLKGEGKRATLESSIAKLFISESLKNAALDAIQIHGAYGYMKEFEIERELRDSIAATIYSGTSEMQKNIIAHLSGL